MPDGWRIFKWRPDDSCICVKLSFEFAHLRRRFKRPSFYNDLLVIYLTWLFQVKSELIKMLRYFVDIMFSKLPCVPGQKCGCQFRTCSTIRLNYKGSRFMRHLYDVIERTESSPFSHAALPLDYVQPWREAIKHRAPNKRCKYRSFQTTSIYP